MAADKVHSHKPLLQRQFRVLKDGSHKAGETLVTMGTLELIVSVPALVDMGAAAERAYNHLTPPLLGNEVTATLVIVEVVDEGDKGVEVFKCKSHSPRYFYLFILENYGNLTKKSSVFTLDFNILRNYRCKQVYRSLIKLAMKT